MNLEKKSKPYPITYPQVMEAYRLVKGKGESPGIDGISIEDIGDNLNKHLYPVYNRLASGSYFPPAVKRHEIPKGDGKVRTLGIPTIKDRIAQTVIAKELEALVDPMFHKNSFGYRPQRSAHQAIAQAKANCWHYPWVIDMDIKGFFDNIDHGLMIRALRYFTKEKHIVLYAKRWMKAPIQLKDGTQIQNTEKGTPQGGVISPILANIFLHVVFDKWMDIHYPDCPFERYADDVIIHVKNEPYARQILKAVRQRFEACKLELHPEKTKLVYCRRKGRRKKKAAKHEQFDFLGFTFRSRKVLTRDGKLMYGFSPSISRKKTKYITEVCRNLRFNRWTYFDIHALSKALTPRIRGWLNYFGKFNITSMHTAFRHINRRIAKWVFNKYKRFKRRKTVYYALLWLRQVAKKSPHLFPHWKAGFTP
ncbi:MULTISPECIES: group II intron reverse transcriptase/maturase [unclassified Carboxylicivirga]|uniref:group II intron reverse transcriptase/maturase n=1 Tax=Carboxylicivirga TaxID=1628153 RepID=UPI003D33BA77